MTVGREGPTDSGPQVLRTIEGIRGAVEFEVWIEPRFDYGEVDAWIRRYGRDARTAIGGDDGIVLSGDLELEAEGHALRGRCSVRPGERMRISATLHGSRRDRPGAAGRPRSEDLDRALDDTIAFWREWATGLTLGTDDDSEAVRSAIVLKALSYDRTGALAAAPTTSLPRRPAASETGTTATAGSATRPSPPSRSPTSAATPRPTPSAASSSAAPPAAPTTCRSCSASAASAVSRRWSWSSRDTGGRSRCGSETAPRTSSSSTCSANSSSRAGAGTSAVTSPTTTTGASSSRSPTLPPSAGASRTAAPGSGEGSASTSPTRRRSAGWPLTRRCGSPRPACARHRSAAGARRGRRSAKRSRPAATRSDRGIFVQAFGEGNLDAALLRLPMVDFIDFDDERMIRTTDAIREGLEVDGLIRRYTGADGLPGQEGAFLPDLLLARAGAGAAEPGARGAGGLRPHDGGRERPRALLGGIRPAAGRDARQLPAGPHASLAHRGRPGARR